MSVAFEGIDRLVVTFLAGDVTAGKPVVMGGEGSVKNASSGQMPVGWPCTPRMDTRRCS